MVRCPHGIIEGCRLSVRLSHLIELVDIGQSGTWTLASFKYSSGKNGSVNSQPYGNDLQVRCEYLVGCDGANSTVRSLQKFTNTDLAFENDWLIVDLVSFTLRDRDGSLD